LPFAVEITEDTMTLRSPLNALSRGAVGAFLLFATLSGNAEIINTPYDFPIKPGTPAWKAFNNHIEKINVCQIPDSILQRLSTNALITTCLRYPLNIDMFCYNDFQIGFQAVSTHFNGLKELLKRADLSNKLFSAYEAIEDADLPPREAMSQAKRHMNIEMLLAQPAAIGSLDISGEMRLLRECWKKYSKKAARSDIFGRYTLSTVCLVMGRVLKNIKERQERIDISLSDETLLFIENPGSATSSWSVIENIAVETKNILK
jgi:hypothetical protein